MKLICENNISKVYDDDKFYVVKSLGKKDLKIDKKDQPVYPLACCLKWNMTPIDVNYLNKLSEKLYGKK